MKKAYTLYIITATFIIFMPLASLWPQDGFDRFQYNGSMNVRGFYLWRDLPLLRQEESVCPGPGSDVRSLCREELDYYQARLRTNLAFRPSAYADILYGLEVGYFTFGRDDVPRVGPGSGGQGSGAANLTTRELRLRLHNSSDTLAFNSGVFYYGTPEGLVLANSGAGFLFEFDRPQWDSAFNVLYFRKEDNSRIDGDSSGFSDDNYQDVVLSAFSWEYTGVSGLRSELYGVYRGDDRSVDDNGEFKDTERLYWGGIFLRYRYGSFGLSFHAVGNWGRIYRHESIVEPVMLDDEIIQDLIPPGASEPDFRAKYAVNAGAGHLRFTYQITDRLELIASIAGASGRLGAEPDGSDSELRNDQFRDAGTGFQYSNIALNASGGYALFANGKLTGLVPRGIAVQWQVFESIESELGYYSIRFYWTPTIDYNQFFTEFPGGKRTTDYLGEEWNLRLTWRGFSDLTVESRAAMFVAGDGYKVLNDIKYGDRMYEIMVMVNQYF